MPDCIVCDSSNVVELGIKDSETVLQCRNCTLVFVDNVDLNDDKVGGEEEKARNNITANRVRLSRLQSPRTILDFGCGHGMFIDFCKQQNISAEGVDLNTELQLETLSKEYDAITLIEVLEHLPDPVAVLSKLKTHLRAGGVLYIEGSYTDTPVLSRSESIDYNVLDWWYLRPCIGHITLFNQQSMEKLCERLGLSLIERRFNVNVFRITKED